MHAVVRSYSGPGAKELFDLIAQRRDDVLAVISGVPGFVSYMVVQTAEGGTTVTVCQDRTGTDESVRRAREWIQANASGLGTSAPVVSEGEVTIHQG